MKPENVEILKMLLLFFQDITVSHSSDCCINSSVELPNVQECDATKAQ
jgi:hypothetical protein